MSERLTKGRRFLLTHIRTRRPRPILATIKVSECFLGHPINAGRKTHNRQALLPVEAKIAAIQRVGIPNVPPIKVAVAQHDSRYKPYAPVGYKYVVMDGNTRILAFRELGLQEIKTKIYTLKRRRRDWQGDAEGRGNV